MPLIKTAALIVAAGKGIRAGQSIPKQYHLIGGTPVLARTLTAFLNHPSIDAVLPVISADDQHYTALAEGLSSDKLRAPVLGGATRQESVQQGLQHLRNDSFTHVLVHDGARPFVSAGLIGRVLDALADAQAVIPALPVKDTLKRGNNKVISGTVDREGLYQAQTPQGFSFSLIDRLHQDYAGQEMTDDASLCEAVGMSIQLVDGEARNFKITTPEDFILAEQQLQKVYEFRTGTGFDVHAFEPGDHVTLCGVDIPHSHSLKGHSDADVAMHTLTDAIYGAVAAGDIGQHFPPSDDKWRGVASEVFLRHACQTVYDKGGTLTALDLTIICETPKVNPHREAMIARLSEITGLSPARISVKATTTEGLGFTGRKEGIAAVATATVRLVMED